MKKIKPISPDKVDDAKDIPDNVIRAFNFLIAKNWNGRQSIVKQDEVIEDIQKSYQADNNPIARETLFDNHYLDIDHLFRKAGWKVVYERPAMDENWDAFWKFTK